MSINELPKKHGIISVILTDPLSQIISKILKLEEDDYNSVGFYYISDPPKVQYSIFLYNIYDNEPIPWIKLGSDLEILISSSFVKKITFHPFRSILISTKQIQNKNSFKSTVHNTIDYNSKYTFNKESTYRRLLLNTIEKDIITGYSIVNRCLLLLMGTKDPELFTNSNNIISCPLLGSPTTLKPTALKLEDNKHIIEKTKKDIKQLCDVIVDLFINNNNFNHNILNYKDNNVSKLIDVENKLLRFLTSGLENGVIDNNLLNELIDDINTERCKLGYNQKIGNSKTPSEIVTVINNNLPYTPQQTHIKNNINNIKELGLQLNNIVESFKEEGEIIIPLGNIISLYNNIIDGSGLEKINIDNDNLVSKQAVITLPSNDLVVKHNNIFIPMYNANLSLFSEYELMDILVYIDSLKLDNIGYANLQNEITNELALRKRKK